MNKTNIFLFFILISICINCYCVITSVNKNPVSVINASEELDVPDLYSFVVDKSENLFAFYGPSEGNDCYVIKLDKNLKFITRFGGYGKGPGEITTGWDEPTQRLSLDEKGNVYVSDLTPPRLVMFTNDGKHVKDIKISEKYGILKQVKACGYNAIACVKFVDWNHRYAILINMSGDNVLQKYDFNEECVYVATGEKRTQGIISSFYGSNPNIASDGKGKVVISNSQKLKFSVFNTHGQQLLKIDNNKRNRTRFSKKEMEQICGTFEHMKNSAKSHYNDVVKYLETRKNVIVDVFIANDLIYVVLVGDDITKDEYPIEVYDMNGFVIKRYKMNGCPIAVTGMYIYIKTYDFEGNLIIKKYSLK